MPYDSFAFIPCKSHSSRIPNKNFVDLGGKQLWEHTVKFCESNHLPYCLLTEKGGRGDNINLFTTSSRMMLPLPTSYHQGHAAELVINVLQEHKFPQIGDDTLIYLLLPTNPFRDSIMLLRSRYLIRYGNATSVVTVVPDAKQCSKRIASGNNVNVVDPVVPNGGTYTDYVHGRTNEGQRVRVVGTLFCSTKSNLLTNGTFHVEATGIVIPPWQAVEIDTLEDLQFAEIVHRGLSKK